MHVRSRYDDKMVLDRPAPLAGRRGMLQGNRERDAVRRPGARPPGRKLQALAVAST